MFRVRKKRKKMWYKCCTIKREEVGFHIPKASKGLSAAEECGCNHHTHLRRDYGGLSTTHSIFLSHSPFIYPSAASLPCFFSLCPSLNALPHLSEPSERLVFYARRNIFKYPNEPRLCHPHSGEINCTAL